MTPLETYQFLIQKHTLDLNKLKKKSSLLGWLRLLSMILFLTSFVLIWKESYLVYTPLAMIFITVFFFLLAKHLDTNTRIDNLKRLIDICTTEIKVLSHHFTDLPDGEILKPDHHEYANDLDIFGRASLFQYSNRCTSEQGIKLFSSWLLHPTSTQHIVDRQQSVNELSQQYEWRQQLQSFGIANPIKQLTEKRIDEWLEEPYQFTNKTYWHLLRFILPAISLGLLVLHLAGTIGSNIFYPAILLMLLVSLGISKLVMPSFNWLNKVAPELETLSDSVSWIEKSAFKSKRLNELKDKYISDHARSSVTIKKLRKILDRADIRLNPLVFLPLNTLTFWDLQQVLILEKWKKENKEYIDDWFHSLAEIEALSSLANLYFNNPDWSFPKIVESDGTFVAETLGHPLIQKDKLVTNSFSTGNQESLNLITGSNMAGKSTFLRSVGVNIVLAMMGSAVHANSLTVSNMKVISSMRISDNLEENTSTFYAELKKLKEVIEAVYRNEKIFLLLDEILRGTNSADRHIGSKALIKQLIGHNAVGMIATHDLELAKLSEIYPDRLHNYHFDVQVIGEELSFDYKLKRGICTSMNASLLMKKIGIEI